MSWLFWWYLFESKIFWREIQREMLVTIRNTTLLQIFFDFMIYFKSIIKSIIAPDDISLGVPYALIVYVIWSITKLCFCLVVTLNCGPFVNEIYNELCWGFLGWVLTYNLQSIGDHETPKMGILFFNVWFIGDLETPKIDIFTYIIWFIGDLETVLVVSLYKCMVGLLWCLDTLRWSIFLDYSLMRYVYANFSACILLYLKVSFL